MFCCHNSKNIVVRTELVICRKRSETMDAYSSIYDFTGSDIFNLSLNQWQAKLTDKNVIA